MNYKELETKIEDFVVKELEQHLDTRLTYHNICHTKAVVSAAKKIADHYKLDEINHFIVMSSAWFHDIGYIDNFERHEEGSAVRAEAFLKENGVEPQIIEAVKSAILATRLPQNPKDLNEKILCDADLSHLGSENFKECSKSLHKELETIYAKDLSKKQWRNIDITFLEKHEYHTDFCRETLAQQKAININQLKEKLEEQEQQKASEKSAATTKEKKNKDDQPSKGVETLFRITSTNNQRLSDMADNKAQILITVNSIILSLVVSLLLRKLEDNTYLIIPTFMLLLVSLFCIVYSILATRPSIPHGTFTQEEIDNKSVNLVFFGNFYKMTLEEYNAGMKKVMNDKEFLYGTLVKDVYAQGVVLGKKYKLIRTAYNIFMFGLIATVLAYMIAYVGYGKLS